MTNEELKAAIELVQRHQDWRRGANIGMENVRLLGVSIDRVLQAARELSQLKDGTHPDMVMVPRCKEESQVSKFIHRRIAVSQKGNAK